MSDIRTIEELEACHGVASLPTRLKIIDHLDAGASAWLAASPFAVVAFDQPDGDFALACAGGANGFATAAGANVLEIPARAIDAGAKPVVGRGAATLFFAPGIGETLRVNGVVTSADDARVVIAVSECFIHCGKAIIRSAFWDRHDGASQSSDVAAQLAAARFCALASIDAEGKCDLSPKGDPAGFVAQSRDGSIVLPDRPGNRLADGFNNMIRNPRASLLALVPGSNKAVIVSGTPRITNDADVLAPHAVDGRPPKLATVISPRSARVVESAAIARARLWESLPRAELNAAAILVGHVKLNKNASEQAAQIRAVANAEFVQKSLDSDYKANLY